MSKKFYQFGANDDVAQPSDLGSSSKITDGGNTITADGRISRWTMTAESGVTYSGGALVPYWDATNSRWVLSCTGAGVSLNGTYLGAADKCYTKTETETSTTLNFYGVGFGSEYENTKFYTASAPSESVGWLPIVPKSGTVVNEGCLLKMGADGFLRPADVGGVVKADANGIVSAATASDIPGLSSKLDADSDADAYDATTTYAAGDFVVYNCKVYQAKQASSSSDPHTPVGGSTDLYWRRANLSSQFSGDNTSLGSTIRYTVDTPTPTAPTVADTYAAGVAYAVGDHVIVSNVAYVCTTAVATSTTWATDSASFAAFDSTTATAYAISTAYAVGASVTYNGNNYLCIAAVTTTANTSWSAVVASFIGTVHSAVTVADFTINTVDSSAKDYCSITFPAARTDGKARDFIIRYICGVAPTFPAGITVESDTAFAEWKFTVGKTYYMSFTETASGVWLGCLKEIA